MIPKILQKDEPVLRNRAEEVPLSKITSPKIQKILKDMAAALFTQDDGVAIAAPQIGVSLRIFLVAQAALRMPKDLEKRRELLSRRDLKTEAGYLTFINPVITKLSRDKLTLEEGCLSVRPLYGRIKRSRKAIIQAYDERGNFFERGGSGLLAQIFQHETDHLNGILFIDKATDLREMDEQQRVADSE
jgi:peptide deformylase